MAYSNYRGERNRNERWRTQDRERDRDEQYTQRDDDDSRLARESMERDYYSGAEGGGRGGYGGREQEDQGPRYNRGYGQGDYDQEYGRSDMGRRDLSQGRDIGQGGRYGQGGYYGQSGRSSESGYARGREYPGREGRHHGNQTGGWEGREEEQWRNRDTHGQYDRDANYGGFGSRTGNYSGYGAGGSYQGGQGRWGQAGTQYSQGGQGYEGYRGQSSRRWGQGSGQPSGERASGEYSGSPSGYFGEDYGRSDWQRRSRWGSEGGAQEAQSRSPQATWGQEQGSAQYRGRGPRGYKRSDERIREEVCDCLTDDDDLDASNIEITVKEGEVTLSGFVTSRDDKRWAESLVERVAGVKEVQNSLRVQNQQRTQSGISGSPPTSGSGSGTTSSTARDKGNDKGTDKGSESNVQH